MTVDYEREVDDAIGSVFRVEASLVAEKKRLEGEVRKLDVAIARLRTRTSGFASEKDGREL